ncbi:MAG: glycosyltransferase [Phycisphaerales bacterium]
MPALNRPLISVIAPAHNEAENLDRLVEEVANAAAKTAPGPRRQRTANSSSSTTAPPTPPAPCSSNSPPTDPGSASSP